VPANVELKARLADFAPAAACLGRLEAAFQAIERQADTYFGVNCGRLKLRERAAGIAEPRAPGKPDPNADIAAQLDSAVWGPADAQLIWYDRPNLADLRASRYWLVPVSEPERLKHILSAACGVRVVVQKRRVIYLWHNVRIHLDQVSGLGAFLEFEAIVGGDTDLAHAHAKAVHLREQFGIDPTAVESRSYSDLLLESAPRSVT
jgi:adenylate cyclase class IV